MISGRVLVILLLSRAQQVVGSSPDIPGRPLDYILVVQTHAFKIGGPVCFVLSFLVHRKHARAGFLLYFICLSEWWGHIEIPGTCALNNHYQSVHLNHRANLFCCANKSNTYVYTDLDNLHF